MTVAEAERDRTIALDRIIDAHATREGPLLPILHAVQAAFGAVDEAAKRHIAARLNLTRAEVHGVVSFYHDFRAEPETGLVIKLCRAEACQAMGIDRLAETLPDGVAVETVYCLGLCSVAPAAMVDGTVHGRLTAERLTALVGG